MFFLIFVFLLILLVASPYISMVLKRRKMLKTIVRIASKNGYRVKPLHKFVLFSSSCAPRYDILIQNKSVAYPVKLWSTAKRGSILIISKDGRMRETYMVEEPLKTDKTKTHTVKGFERKIKSTKDNFKVRASKSVTPIILFYPCNRAVFADFGNSRRKIEFGDRIFKKVLCSVSGLERMLVSDESVIDAKKLSEEVKTLSGKNE